jgi:hypothetical protein
VTCLLVCVLLADMLKGVNAVNHPSSCFLPGHVIITLSHFGQNNKSQIKAGSMKVQI